MLLYFFRKKIAFCNHYGLYTILGLYAVTFVRMVFPFEFKFTYTVSDKNVYAAIMDVLTPNKDVLFVPEFTWLNLLVAVYCYKQVEPCEFRKCDIHFTGDD